MKLEKPKKVKSTHSLGHTTTVTIGLVIGILGTLFACAWWGATVSAKLDVLVGNMGNVQSDYKALRNDVDSFKLWRAEVDRSGTRALDELRKEVSALRMEFEIHSRTK